VEKSQRNRTVIVGTAVAVAVAYLAVVAGYGVSTLNTGVHVTPEAPAAGIALDFVPTTTDPGARTISGVLYVVPGSQLVDSTGRLAKELSLDVLPAVGSSATTFKVGQSVATMNVVIATTGNVRNYPFDVYKTEVITSASVRESATSQWVPIPIAAGAVGELTGWNISLTSPESVDINGEVFKTSAQYGIKVIELRRTESTVAIALIVLVLMALLAAFAAQ